MPVPYQNVGPIDCAVSSDLTALKGKSVVVTGGSSGLGLAYVKSFLDAGAYVTNADLVPPAGDDIKASNSYQYLKCDVRIWAEQLAVFKAAKLNSPRKGIDIVVANAGIAGYDPVHTLDEAEEPTEPDLQILNINLIGVMYTTKLAMHYFNQQRNDVEGDRCLILKSSLAGYIDLPTSPLYQTAKYGVRGLMHCLRRSDYMRVCVIAPWFVATAIISDKAVDMLTQTFKELDLDWALAEDSSKAVLRVATDPTINGRTLAIVPRTMVREGYVDLGHDDYEAGTLLDRLQVGASAVKHRAALPSQKNSKAKRTE